MEKQKREAMKWKDKESLAVEVHLLLFKVKKSMKFFSVL